MHNAEINANAFFLSNIILHFLKHLLHKCTASDAFPHTLPVNFIGYTTQATNAQRKKM
jgi:hypothetical protein